MNIPAILNLGHIGTATFSPCRQYRYTLFRQWSMADGEERQGNRRERAYAMFIGLNPSTADETNDDPTIRRCRSFAKSWGYGAMFMLNLFAFRTTHPQTMMGVADPIGQDNDTWLKHCGREAGIIMAAWGKHGSFLKRDAQVLALLAGILRTDVQCFGRNKDNSPRHPLYLRLDCKREPFWKAA